MCFCGCPCERADACLCPLLGCRVLGISPPLGKKLLGKERRGLGSAETAPPGVLPLCPPQVRTGGKLGLEPPRIGSFPGSIPGTDRSSSRSASAPHQWTAPECRFCPLCLLSPPLPPSALHPLCWIRAAGGGRGSSSLPGLSGHLPHRPSNGLALVEERRGRRGHSWVQEGGGEASRGVGQNQPLPAPQFQRPGDGETP